MEATVFHGREMLGYGQGVDIVTGTTILNAVWNVGDAGFYDNDKTVYVKSSLTNEVYTKSQWIALNSNTYPEGQVGKEGDIVNVYWEWDTNYNDWHWIGEH